MQEKNARKMPGPKARIAASAVQTLTIIKHMYYNRDTQREHAALTLRNGGIL